MRAICFNFQVHQPFHYRRYRFFDIGNDHYYYDDYSNETTLRKLADQCYLPANKLMLELIEKYKGKFKISYSISGTAIEQFELYAPEVLESFQKLAQTGHVEFIAETYSHSLVSLKDKDAFKEQVRKHEAIMLKYFGQRSEVFRNTEMIYSDEVGELVAEMGYKGILTEGAKHILGWKSANFLYCNSINPRLKVLMRNYKLSDDIGFRFSNEGWNEYPLTATKFVDWVCNEEKDEIFNVFMDYETFGFRQKKDTGIFDFLEALPAEVLKSEKLSFAMPSEIIKDFQPISAVGVPYNISWADEERDLTAWLGNEMQQEAFNKLYELQDSVLQVKDEALLKDWDFLQVSDHFYYMSTKFFSDGETNNYDNPFESPYEAFINYMNVLSDFKIRLSSLVPMTKVDQEISALNKILEEKETKIQKYEAEIKKMQASKSKKKAKKVKLLSGTTSPSK